MPLAIEDYALIGDCQTAALVGRNGSIDWLCWPRFDSDAVFAALLGDEQNGRWLLAPQRGEDQDGECRATRRYRGNTLVLDTRFETRDGVVVVTDFMPPRGTASDIIRIVHCERGSVAMSMELLLRFGYGVVVPWVSRLDAHTIRAIAGADMVVLHGDVDMHGEGLSTVSRFVITAGQTVTFSLTYQLSHLPLPQLPNVAVSLQDTQAFWCDWLAQGSVDDKAPPHLVRSLITLRALIYAPTGGIVAAPTTSLPEQLNSTRNWDYRFCWLRDATLTLLALMNAGFYAEARAWREWLLRAIAGSAAQLQILYGVAGERRLTEWEVPWLKGYQGAQPVRIGNAAHAQLQLDVLGEVMDVLYQARRGGVDGDDVAWAMQCKLLDYLDQMWREPDAGIWEVRGPLQHFTYSKVMAWVAYDRAVKSVEQFNLSGAVERWRDTRDAIHADICAHAFDRELNSFVQAYGSRLLDASLLLLAPVGFVAADDPRYRGTVAAIERQLLKDGFVLRYDTTATHDGLPPGEGAFIACTFWLVDAYLMIGRRDEAQRLFARLCGLCNDVGLLAEEYSIQARRFTGNFPQAFSHIALIGSAYNLFYRDKPAQQRGETSPS